MTPSSTSAVYGTESFSFDAGASDASGLRAKSVCPVARSTASALDAAGEFPGTASACASRFVSGAFAVDACAASGSSAAASNTIARSALRTRPIVTEVAAAPETWASFRRKMGRAALAAHGRPTNNRLGMSAELFEEISALIEASDRDLDRIERTLTDGTPQHSRSRPRRGASSGG